MRRLDLRSGVPIFWGVLASFAVVVLAQHLLYGATIYQNAWKQYRAQIDEKHLLIARRLSASIHEYFDKHLAATSHVAALVSIDQQALSAERLKMLLASVFPSYPNLKSLTLYDAEHTRSISVVASGQLTLSTKAPDGAALNLDSYFHTPSSELSGIVKSPFSGRPCILIRRSLPADNTPFHYVVAELDPEPLTTLRSQIHFGTGGHAAIVDHRGHLAAHPNEEWTREMRDISDWPIVTAALAGGDGVMEFVSPHAQENMISAYAFVSHYGWAVLIPQPESEIDNQVHGLVLKQIGWIVISLVVVAFVAWRVALWISRPLRLLARHAGDLEDEQYAVRSQIGNSKGAPQEINRLCYALNSLLYSLKNSMMRQDRFREQILYIVEHSPLLLCVSDFDGKIQHAAGRLLKEFNLTPESAEGLDLPYLFGPDIFTDDLISQLRDGGEELVRTFERPRPDDSSAKGRVIELWCTALRDKDGNPENVMVVGTDISDTRLAQTHAMLLDENRKLNVALIEAEEKERRRIAGELHDLFGQDLTAIQTYLRLIDAKLTNVSDSAPEEMKTCAAFVQDYATTATKTTESLQAVIRSMLERLWPEALENIGLFGALKEHFAKFRIQYPSVDLSFDMPDQKLDLPLTSRYFIYRAVTECLANVGKHAKASHVSVVIGIHDGRLNIVIEDDGVGFDPDTRFEQRYGITGVKERVRALRGTSFFHSAPGHGTTVTLDIPLPEQALAV